MPLAQNGPQTLYSCSIALCFWDWILRCEWHLRAAVNNIEQINNQAKSKQIQHFLCDFKRGSLIETSWNTGNSKPKNNGSEECCRQYSIALALCFRSGCPQDCQKNAECSQQPRWPGQITSSNSAVSLHMAAFNLSWEATISASIGKPPRLWQHIIRPKSKAPKQTALAVILSHASSTMCDCATLCNCGRMCLHWANQQMLHRKCHKRQRAPQAKACWHLPRFPNKSV